MLEVIIALSLAILLGNILAHKIRITPAIMLIFMGLVLALIPVHAMHEVREVLLLVPDWNSRWPGRRMGRE